MKTQILTAIAAAAVLAGGFVLPQESQAACNGGVCPLSFGSMRLMPGNGRQFPRTPSSLPGPTVPGNIAGTTSSPPPNLISSMNWNRGLPRATASAQVTVSSGAHPRSIMMTGGQIQRVAGTEVDREQAFLANPMLFEVRDRKGMSFPSAPATFAAGGRLGPATVTWCAGAPLPSVSYQACVGPNTVSTTPTSFNQTPTLFPGLLRYTATSNQFGGSAGGNFVNNEGAALINISGLPGAALPGTVPALRAVGGLTNPVNAGQGWSNLSTVLGVRTIITAMITTNGLATPFSNATAFPSFGNPGAAIGMTIMQVPGEAVQNAFGPFTTGRVTMLESVFPANNYRMTGADQRNPTNGEGTVSMVAGMLQNRPQSILSSTWRTSVQLWLPEPGLAIGLFAGLGLLGGLSRRRR